MANEVKVTATLTVEKSFLSVSRKVSGLTADMSGTLVDGSGQSIGTSHEQVNLSSDIGTAGWALFRNLDATNYVEIGLDVGATFYPLAKLNAGECALFRLATTTFYARANTAAVDLDKFVIEE